MQQPSGGVFGSAMTCPISSVDWGSLTNCTTPNRVDQVDTEEVVARGGISRIRDYQKHQSPDDALLDSSNIDIVMKDGGQDSVGSKALDGQTVVDRSGSHSS